MNSTNTSNCVKHKQTCSNLLSHSELFHNCIRVLFSPYHKINVYVITSFCPFNVAVPCVLFRLSQQYYKCYFQLSMLFLGFTSVRAGTIASLFIYLFFSVYSYSDCIIALCNIFSRDGWIGRQLRSKIKFTKHNVIWWV